MFEKDFKFKPHMHGPSQIDRHINGHNNGLIRLALFGKREREVIKSGFGLDLTEGDGMVWWMDGRHGYLTILFHEIYPYTNVIQIILSSNWLKNEMN